VWAHSLIPTGLDPPTTCTATSRASITSHVVHRPPVSTIRSCVLYTSTQHPTIKTKFHPLSGTTDSTPRSESTPCPVMNWQIQDAKKGTLHSVDLRTWDPGPGPRTRDPGTRDPWIRIGIHCTCTYIYSTCISNHSIGMHYQILCTVDSTFALAAFVPFHSVRHQKRPLYCR